jgi:hypothetical protein
VNVLIFQYVDPGTGSLLTQLLLSVAIGAGFYLMTARRRIGNWLRGLKRSREFADAPEKNEPKKE